ncbi:MAG: UDP-N-acetylmuramate dehydrogenase [Clostridia bacterium]|nr:UDP-N-acetylmuramate dehydrogenase [Clostridia bacterium]
MSLENIISKEKIKVNEDMSKHTSFKTGGRADYYITANTVEEIQGVMKYAKNNNIKVYIIGNGSNLLVSDEGIRGIVLRLDLPKVQIEENGEDVLVTVGAGVKVMALAQKLMKDSVSGFEELSGIPGTVGGAIKMNAGAYGKEMKDIVLSTVYMDEAGRILELSNEEQEFSYRHSTFFERNYIILETKLLLKKGDSEQIKQNMNSFLQARKEKQPVEFPSAGSTFKRGKDFITAKLIDDCGLKGYSIGGAQISEKHAGFIINKGNATSQDIFDLIRYTKRKVFEKFKVKIEEEVEFIGKFDK